MRELLPNIPPLCLAEDSMRPVALGRKNRIHIGSPLVGPNVASSDRGICVFNPIAVIRSLLPVYRQFAK